MVYTNALHGIICSNDLRALYTSDINQAGKIENKALECMSSYNAGTVSGAFDSSAEGYASSFEKDFRDSTIMF